MTIKLFEVTVVEKLEESASELTRKRKPWMHKFIALGENEAEAIANARAYYPAWFENADTVEAEVNACDRAMKLRSMKTNRRT